MFAFLFNSLYILLWFIARDRAVIDMAISRPLFKLAALLYTGSVTGFVTNFHLPDGGRVAMSAHGATPDNETEAVHARSHLDARATWTLLGCYTDSVSARSLPYAAGVPGGPSAMTNELCQSTCAAAGYTLAGTEYSDECCK